MGVESDLIVGVLASPDDPTSGMAHAWINVNGNVIDNAFAYDPEGRDILFTFKDDVRMYHDECPVNTTRDMYEDRYVSEC